MNILLVVAHPLKSSLCHALAERIAAQLSADGHAVTIEDLYGSAFDPTLTPAERAAYYAPERLEGDPVRTARLGEAEGLVLVFPTWWFGFPAILKGWFDRVFLPGIAYRHADDLGAIRPNLPRLRHVFAVTTLGAAGWVDWLVMFRPVYRILRYAIIGTCAPQAKLDYLALYRAERVTPERFEAFCTRIEKAIRRWPRG